MNGEKSNAKANTEAIDKDEHMPMEIDTENIACKLKFPSSIET